MTKQLSVLLLGAGNMGGALLEGWLTAGVIDPARSVVVDPTPSDRVLRLCDAHGVRLNPVEDEEGYGVAVLAVKPQQFPAVLPDLMWTDMHRTLFISIAAGVTIDTIGMLLKGSAPTPRIVRTMPNLPVAVGSGMTLLTPGAAVTDTDRMDTEQLFGAVGGVLWTETEDGLDRLMGVSGCGPAFLFHLVEAMAAAAETQGATPDEARQLAEATVVGAAQHLRQDGRPAGDLRAAVTSPGGTTAAALSVLMDGDRGITKLMNEAVEKAYVRAQEMAAD